MLPQLLFETILLTVIGPFFPSKIGNRFVVVIHDLFSSSVQHFLVQDNNAQLVGWVLKEFVVKCGAPSFICSTSQMSFLLTVLDVLHQRFNISLIRPVRPNPEIENKCNELKEQSEIYISRIVREHPTIWYNNRMNRVLHETYLAFPHAGLYLRH